MPGSGYFVTLAGLGVSFAGFAGLIAALDRRPNAHSPVRMWRIRNIVADGFMLTVVGLGVIAIHDASQGNVELAIRFGSLLYVVRYLFILRPSNITGPAWRTSQGAAGGGPW